MAKIEPGEAYLSALTVGELRRGVELRRRTDPRAANSLDRWLKGLEAHYGERILPVTASIAARWGRICLEQPLPVVDGLIAATALDHDLTVVTRNTEDFRRSGADVLNPFS